MTNDPQLDAAPAPVQAEANPFHDLVMSSRNYWAGRTGREKPPAPTFRMVNGKQLLGRYMDPYGCQAHMRAQHSLWEQWYTGFFVSCAVAIVFGAIDWFTAFIAIPGYACWYFYVKAKHTAQYNLYYSVQDEIIKTEEPQWVPYDRERLKMLDSDPRAVWP